MQGKGIPLSCVCLVSCLCLVSFSDGPAGTEFGGGPGFGGPGAYYEEGFDSFGGRGGPYRGGGGGPGDRFGPRGAVSGALLAVIIGSN